MTAHQPSVFLLLSMLVGQGQPYQYFQNRIPNGASIPHPCKPNLNWPGLGHRNSQGGGEKNPFGVDFFNNGKIWNKALCQKDSDGDGKTNGEELGDPQCTWILGQTPKLLTGLSHPGVCQPTDSEVCLSKNQWEFCDNAEFSCEHIHSSDVKNMTLRYPPTNVPAQETNYMCMDFEVPSDKDYHIIADRPYINNTMVMHHILIYGCTGVDSKGRKQNMIESKSPQLCGMATGYSCNTLLLGWTLGHPGICYPDNIGFLFGNSSFKYFRMQMHWNNPELRSDYVDSSGMVLYYTDKLRKNNAVMTSVGQLNLHITPHTDPTYYASCSSQCTQIQLPHPIHIIESILHMHYLGKSGSLIHYRNGTQLQVIFNEEVYSYDNPQFRENKHSIPILPGDELKLICKFKRSKSGIVRYGDATSDEMCFGFFIYYPALPNWKGCSWHDPFDYCGLQNPNYVIDGCLVHSFVKRLGSVYAAFKANPQAIAQHKDGPLFAKLVQVPSVCRQCTKSCMDFIRPITQSEPCIASHKAGAVTIGMLNSYTRDLDFVNEGKKIIGHIEQCNRVMAFTTSTTPLTTVKTSSANTITVQIILTTGITMASILSYFL